MTSRFGYSIVAAVCVACSPGCKTRHPASSSHVVDSVAECDRYVGLNPHFAKAFAFLKRADLAELAPGRYEIDGSNCWAFVQEPDLCPLAEAKTEFHRAYIDIQAPLTGPETYGFCTPDAKQRALPFDTARDVVLFNSKTTPRTLRPGEFAIFFPPDGAHAPGCSMDGRRKIRKVVVKVRNER